MEFPETAEHIDWSDADGTDVNTSKDLSDMDRMDLSMQFWLTNALQTKYIEISVL